MNRRTASHKAAPKPVVFEPTPERVSHAVAAPYGSTKEAGIERAVRLLIPPVELYARKGLIEPRQFSAAEALYESFAFGVHGVRTGGDFGGGRSGYGPRSISTARIEHLERYRRMMRLLDPFVAQVAHAVVCGESSCTRFAADHGASPRRAMKALRDALDAIADALDARSV